jgi:hypothetical protein
MTRTIEDFLAHAENCEHCQQSSIGLCPTAFRLLGLATLMRREDPQLEFPGLGVAEPTIKPSALTARLWPLEFPRVAVAEPSTNAKHGLTRSAIL